MIFDRWIIKGISQRELNARANERTSANRCHHRGISFAHLMLSDRRNPQKMPRYREMIPGKGRRREVEKNRKREGEKREKEETCRAVLDGTIGYSRGRTAGAEGRRGIDVIEKREQLRREYICTRAMLAHRYPLGRYLIRTKGRRVRALQTWIYARAAAHKVPCPCVSLCARAVANFSPSLQYSFADGLTPNIFPVNDGSVSFRFRDPAIGIARHPADM